MSSLPPPAAAPSSRRTGLSLILLVTAARSFVHYLGLSVLVFHLSERLGLSISQTAAVFGSYMGAMYFLPLVTGPLIDRVIGARTGQLAGLLLSGFGALFLGLPGPRLWPISFGLLLLALGMGLLRTSSVVLIDDLYPAPRESPSGEPAAAEPPGRDGAFLLWHLCLSLSAGLAPVVGGVCHAMQGTSVMFVGAGILLLGLSLGMFLLSSHLPAYVPPAPTLTPGPSLSWTQRLSGGMVLATLTALVLPQLTGSSQTRLMTMYIEVSRDRPLGSPLVGLLGLLVIPVALVGAMVALFGLLQRRGVPTSSLKKIGVGIVLAAAQAGLVSLVATVGLAAMPSKLGVLFSLWCMGCVGEVLLGGMAAAMVTRFSPAGWRASAVAIAALVGSLFWRLIMFR